MNVNFEYYKIFYYVAKYGNISQAAKMLMNNQPNLTRSIKNLEGELGCTLFVRSNRGMKLTFSPVKEYALTQDLPVYQPLKMRDGEALGILRELAPELIVVAAYGKILPQEILDLPQYGCINVHSSLLPKYRGAHQLGDPERRAHYRRFHHVYGRGARRGRCHPHGLDRDR